MTTWIDVTGGYTVAIVESRGDIEMISVRGPDGYYVGRAWSRAITSRAVDAPTTAIRAVVERCAAEALALLAAALAP